MTKYTKDHEYITADGTVGITPYAQEQLGDIVFVELPKVGQKLKQGDEAAVVESVKAASEIYAPASGTVTAVNDALTGEPGLINSAPETDWLDLQAGRSRQCRPSSMALMDAARPMPN